MTPDAVEERVLAALLAMQRRSWEQGVAAQAVLDLGRTATARVMARDAVALARATGELAEPDAVPPGAASTPGAVNSAAAGEVVAWAASTSTDPIEAALLGSGLDAQLRWLVRGAPRADDGTLFHLHGARQVWVDTVFMVVPLLVATGHADVARAQVEGHRRRLHDEGSGLYAARWDEDAGHLVDARHWGSGNGWVVAGIARALHHATSHPSRDDRSLHEEWGPHARTVLDACLTHRRPDGVFTDVLDDVTTFSEATAASMLSYAAATGVADGWLPGSYAGTARSLLDAVRDRVDDDGLVTGVCGAPTFDHQGTSAEAQASFLLAAAAQRRLAA